MLTYAGVPLLDPGPEMLSQLRRDLDPSWLPLWADRGWPGFAVEALGFTGRWPHGPLALNTLVWPAGASRFAHFHGLVDEEGLKEIRDQVFASAQPAAKDLVLDDGTAALTTAMEMLPALPLERALRESSPEAASGLYLLTLVDDRYFWWYSSADVRFSGGDWTWGQLYSRIGTGLGVTVEADDVHAAYPPPGDDLAAPRRALPVVLDAAAFSCGQRVIRRLDGTVKAVSADESLAAHERNLGREPGDTASRLDGHEYDLAAAPGGRDLKALAPARVVVAFPRLQGGTLGDAPLRRLAGARAFDARRAHAPYTVSVTLESLGLAGYQGARGFDGEKVLWSTARLCEESGSGAGSGSGGGLGTAELAALAERAARDWYTWRLGRAGARYQGVTSWEAEAHADVVEWAHGEGRLFTLARRGAFLEHLEDLLHDPGCEPAVPSTGSPCTVTFVTSICRGSLSGSGSGG
jgi:hypothetical protein